MDAVGSVAHVKEDEVIDGVESGADVLGDKDRRGALINGVEDVVEC